MRKLVYIIAALIAIGCGRVPDGVIPPDRMASLMADMRMADAIVKVRPSDYVAPARKLAIRNAVFERHGITAAEYDSSLVWYGHNIKRYQDVTDRSIEILEQRLIEANAIAADGLAMSVAGDSVDLWLDAMPWVVTRNSPSNILTFSNDSDANWQPGDAYTLRARIVTPVHGVRWNITTWYSDGALETVTGSLSTLEPHRQEMTMLTDSTRTAVRVAGYILVEPEGHKPVILDSLSLTRRHPVPGVKSQRNYQQRLYVPRTTDTITAR
ncbi:MAG: DUF4296 domain-containing protein [Muribaculaceae bacterium]|nr:DUF4296 domain-containing protein [Muribaculaceae bacterium]